MLGYRGKRVERIRLGYLVTNNRLVLVLSFRGCAVWVVEGGSVRVRI